MLPFDLRDVKAPTDFMESDGRFPDYLRRLTDIKQMDFEAAFEQLLTLLSFEPNRV